MPAKSAHHIIDNILGPFSAKQIIIKGYYSNAVKIIDDKTSAVT